MADILTIAHRGARSLAPENTLAAARKAFELGADMWEIDIGVAADGELILFHDDSLTRTTNAETVFPDRAPWTVTTFTLSELKQLDVGSKFIESDPFDQIAAGAVTAEEQAALQGESIATLHEALILTREHNCRVNIEIKKLPPPMDSFPVVEKVVELVEELDMVEQILISSFVHPNIYHTKALNPAISIAALLGYWGTTAITWPTDLQAEAVHPRHDLTDNNRIRSLRQNGFDVNLWTVNDTVEMERLIQAGATGIITDFPQVLKEVLSDLDC
jgi:glycerophosphoryl diester phosphodiesterase